MVHWWGKPKRDKGYGRISKPPPPTQMDKWRAKAEKRRNRQMARARRKMAKAEMKRRRAERRRK